MYQPDRRHGDLDSLAELVEELPEADTAPLVEARDDTSEPISSAEPRRHARNAADHNEVDAYSVERLEQGTGIEADRQR